MKLKTNKLLTLTLASSLVAITAGCGGTKAAAPKGGTDDKTPVVVDTVTYSDWSGSATIATVVTDNAFLAGTAAVAAAGTTAAVDASLTGLPTDASNTTAGTLNLASQVAPVDGTVSAITLGGEAADGVAFATVAGTESADSRYFAGVIAGTDLGAPVPTTGTSATWSNGLFQAVGADGTYATASKTFALTVTFGTTDTARTITALVAANDNEDTFGTGNDASYYISGTYNAAGVITGNVLYDDFSAAADAPAALTAAETAFGTATAAGATGAATDGVGTLSGLIGAQGALGVFYSSGNDGTGATGFAGGFVVSALPNVGGEDSNVVYADWSAGATQATVITANAFLASATADADGLVYTQPTPAITPTVETLNLASETHAQVPAQVGVAGAEARTLGGAATNGVAFFTTGTAATSRYFAGLHFGTDLGAPVGTTDPEATWNGLFQTVSGTAGSVIAAQVFELTVNFGTTDAARTISAHVAAGAVFTGTSYLLAGTYDANGVITGTVSSGVITADATGRAAATETGTLSGLIGATGAVGAFHSTLETAAGYAGGFVARPGAIAAGTPIAALPAPEVVEYADLSSVTRVPALTANGFLASSGTDVLTFTDSSPAVTQVKVDLSAGAGGVTFFETEDGSGAFYKAGIHNDTSLGAPITSASEASGTWSGIFGAVGDTAHTTAITKAITLTVAFGSTDAARTITALVPANDNTDTFTTAGDTSYYISGTYNAAGVITGNVLYADFATANANDADARTAAGTALTAATATTGSPSTVGLGTLTGLIGQSGAVGAFHSSGSDGEGTDGYAGGFAVTRTAPGS